MRYLFAIVHLAMAGYLIVSAAYRVAQQLAQGADLEVLPFISGGLGLVGLLMLILASDTLPYARRRAMRRRRRAQSRPRDPEL